MPALSTTNQQRLNSLSRSGWTSSDRDFRLMLKHLDRPAIIVEGDSWFAYPPKALITAQNSNVFRFVRNWCRPNANLLHVASNGDEATAMLSGAQRHALTRRLDEYQPAALLFSGGGNDVVGEYDLVRFIQPFQAGMTAEDCIDEARWSRKLRQIALAHHELIDITQAFSPATVIITHSYDIPFITGQHAEFWKMIKPGPWIKPYLDARGLPASLHRDVIRVMFDGLRTELEALAAASGGRYVVAPTQGLLDDPKWWRDELHPTSEGFERVARAVYQALRAAVPSLPAP